MLGQGTIYPDTIESGATKNADKIKTHHNRVPEIQEMIDQGLVIEPLEQLYKDEVRQLGEALGLPHHLVWRHPFPGPGLAIRMLCTGEEKREQGKEESTKDSSVSLFPRLKEDEKLANEYLEQHGLKGTILPLRSVGVQGDARTYRHPLAIWPTGRSSESEGGPADGNWEKHWDKDQLHDIATTLTNRFESINRVVFTLSSLNSLHSFSLLPGKTLTPDRVSIIQDADKIVMDSIMDFDDQEKSIWQCPTVLLPIGSSNDQNTSSLPTGQAGNDQSQEASSLKPQAEALLLRPVSSIDAMTADATIIPAEELKKIVSQLSALDPKPSAIFYDLTNKPPGTIEWE